MVEENVSGNNRNTKVHFDDSINEIHYPWSKTPSFSSASSNSSLESTLTDKDNYPSPQFEIQLSPNNFNHGQTSSTLMDSTSPYSSTHAMGRSVGYDPNRIPASIFGKPNSPMDWSVASNESLFSIHMGNNSFSRDHNFLLYRSGELTKLDEVFSVPMGLPTVDEALSMPRASNCSGFDLLGPEACDYAKTIELESLEDASRKSDVTATSMETNEAGLNTTTPTEEEEEEDHGKEKTGSPVAEHARTSTSLSIRSDGSANSATSFAFPVLAAQETKVVSRKIPTIKEDVTKEQPRSSQPHSSPRPLSQRPPKQAKASVTHLFSCFSCCSCRCSLPLK